MLRHDPGRIVVSRIFPDNGAHIIRWAENLIENYTEVLDLVVVDADENYPIIGKEIG